MSGKQFLFVSQTTASGIHKLVSTRKQKINALRCMWLRKQLRSSGKLKVRDRLLLTMDCVLIYHLLTESEVIAWCGGLSRKSNGLHVAFWKASHSFVGPVCVVSIAGPYRKGKSYILSEAFAQPDVFPLGHKLSVETMGIWLWIVPEKYKVSKNLSFTGR